MVIKGNDLIISLDGVAIAGAKSCEIEVDCDFKEVSSPTSGRYRTYKADRMSWSVRVSRLILDDATVCGHLLRVKNLYDLSMSVRGNEGLDRIDGQAFLQHADASGSRGGLAAGSWVFLGNGEITMPLVLADKDGVPFETAEGELLTVPTSTLR